MAVGGGRQLGRARHRKDCQASPHPKNPLAPSYPDGNRKTDTLVLGGTVAATFTASPHCEPYALWQEVQPHVAVLLPPAPPLLWVPGTSQAPRAPICPVHVSQDALCCKVQALRIPLERSQDTTLCQIRSLESLQSHAIPALHS